MKKKVLFAGTACRYQTSTTAGTWIDSVEEVAVYQLLSTASELADSTKMPRTAWAGYELPFLEEQLEHKVNIDSIHPNPAFVLSPIGPAVSFLVHCGMLTS